MFLTYEDYCKKQKSLSLEEMTKLHKEMREEINSDPDALDLYQELIETATRYLFFRSNWMLWNLEEKAEKDPSRTSCHNSVIVKFNQLARYLTMQGKAASWREVLGYEEENPYFRKRIGDFACYLAFINSLLAR